LPANSGPENTVKVHHGRPMEQMRAQSLPDLVKMIEKLEAQSEKTS
jgi:FixJ family two-component response regulator